MRLIDQFIVKEPEQRPPHYELYVEGDWNDADYVDISRDIKKEDLENNDFLLYFISYMTTGSDSHFMEDDPDWDLFNGSYLASVYLPRAYDANIHTITDVQLNYVDEDGRRYCVEVPRWRNLFKDYDDMVEKVTSARKRFEDEFGENTPSAKIDEEEEPIEDEIEMVKFKERLDREVLEDLERMKKEYQEYDK